MLKPMCIAVVVGAIGSVVATDAQAVAIFKDDTNPTGVPDVYQGDGAFCEAAAWADGIWWYNQHRPGLVDTRADGWYARSQTLFTDLRTRIYDNSQGQAGVLRYIHDHRPDDFSPANHPRARNTRVIESTWAVEHAFAARIAGRGDRVIAPAANLESEAQASIGNAHRFAVLGVELHEQGDAANEFSAPLSDGSQGTWGHAMAYAGRDTDAQGSLTHVFLSHGWAPSHEAEANPVAREYYDRLAVDIVNPGIANYTAEQLRITDRAGFFGMAGGLAGNAQIDYAAATRLDTLRDDHRTFYAFTYFDPRDQQAPGPQANVVLQAPVGPIVMSNALENVGEGPLYEFAFELPLRSPLQPDWLSSVAITLLPPGWSWDFWDPNVTPYMTPPALFDEFGSLERGYRGIHVFTDSNPLLDGETLLVELAIDRALLDLSQSVLSYGIADPGRHYFAESLGFRVAVVEPATFSVLGLGLVVLARRRRACASSWRTRRYRVSSAAASPPVGQP